MTTERRPMTIGEALVGTSIAPLIKRRFLKKGRWVPDIAFRVKVGLWVFIKAALIGRHFRNNTGTLVQTFSAPGVEKEALDDVVSRATRIVESLPAGSATLQSLWSHVALGASSFDAAWLAGESGKGDLIRLGEALHQADELAVVGIGFGATFPETLESMWLKSFDDMSLEDTEAAALEDFTEYVSEIRPDLLAPLGLKA